MKAIWQSVPPVTTFQIAEKLSSDKRWKPQTVLTMLVRLCEKGFVESIRVGRERNYTPLISEQEYFQVETGDFMKRYTGNSIGSLVKNLCGGQELSPEDIRELKEFLDERS